MRRITFVISICLFLQSPLLASDDVIRQDTLKAHQILLVADSLIEEQIFDQAEHQYRQASKLFEASNYAQRQAYCLAKIAQINVHKSASTNAQNMLKSAESLIQQSNQKYPVIIAATYNELGNQYLQKDPIVALSYFQKALSLQQKSIKSVHPTFDVTIDQIARYYYRKQQNDSAVYYFRSLIELRQNLFEGDHIQVGGAYINAGMTYRRLPDNEKAIEFLNKGIEIYKNLDKENDGSVATAYNNLGIIHNQLGIYDKSEAYLKKSLEIRIAANGPEHRSVAYSYNSLGLLAMEMGKYDQASDHFQKSLEIRRNVYGETHPLVAKTYSNLGLVKEKIGAYDEAVELFQKATRELSKIFGPNHSELFNAYNNLGLIHHYRKEYQQAIELFEKTLAIQIETLGENHFRVGRTYSNLGEAHRELELYNEAIAYFERALEIHERTLGIDHQETAQILVNYGRALHDGGAPEKGLTYYLKAANILKKAVSPDHPKIIENLLLQAEALVNLEDFDRAIHILQQSHQMSISIGSPMYLRSLQLELDMLVEAKDSGKKPLNYPELKSKFYQADSIILNMQMSLLRYEDRLLYSKLGNALYIKAVDLFYHASIKEKGFLEDAFYFAERSRASLLAQNINHHQARSFSGLPASLLNLEKDLKAEISHYQTLINAQNTEGSNTRQLYEEKVFLQSRKLDSLIGVFEKVNPAYHQMKYNRDLMSLQTIQAKLDDHEALIEYVETDSVILAFILTSTGINLKKVENKTLVLSSAQHYLKTIQETYNASSLTAFKKWSSFLYDQLLSTSLASISEDITSLIIIPSASLSLIPWETLTEDLSGDNYKSLSYLIRKYNINYAHSANLLFGEKFSSGKQSNKTVLALAPSYESSIEQADIKAIFRDQLVPLQWNRPEASVVSKALNGDIYEGANATESNFKQEASNYQILHLAMHALVDHDESMNSKLVFTQSKDSIEDGMLHTFEVFNMELPAEMVVLSACNTGVGQVQEGEGVMSLARAFAYAGVPSLVMSQWNVNDESTSKLMASFYQNLADGQRKDVALKNAKLDFLNNANEIQASPFYWGGFVLVGETKPINQQNYSQWIIFAVVISAALIALLFFKRRSTTTLQPV